MEPALVPLPTTPSQVLRHFVSDPEDVTDPNDAEDTDCDGDTSQTAHTEDERTACYCTLVAWKVLWELGESEYFPMPMVFCSVDLVWATLVSSLSNCTAGYFC